MNPDESRSSYISYEHISKFLHNGCTSASCTWPRTASLGGGTDLAGASAGELVCGRRLRRSRRSGRSRLRRGGESPSGLGRVPTEARHDPKWSNTQRYAKMYYTYLDYLHVCIQVNVNVWYTFIDLNTDIFLCPRLLSAALLIPLAPFRGVLHAMPRLRGRRSQFQHYGRLRDSWWKS